MKIHVLKMSLALLALGVFVNISVLAQDSRENGKQIEGTWSIVTTNRDCATGELGRTFPAMETFARGGTTLEFSLGAATSGQTPLGNRTTSQGIWRYVANGVYSSASMNFRFDSLNVYMGWTRRDAEIVLSDDGNSFTSTGTERFYNSANILTGTRCNNQAGTRFE